jgi:hypothetical protein
VQAHHAARPSRGNRPSPRSGTRRCSRRRSSPSLHRIRAWRRAPSYRAEVLDDRFDTRSQSERSASSRVGRMRARVAAASARACSRGLSALLGSLLGELREASLDPSDPESSALRSVSGGDDLQSGLRRDLDDAVPHQPAADHSHFLICIRASLSTCARARSYDRVPPRWNARARPMPPENAQCRQAVRSAAASELVQECHHDTRSRAPIGWPSAIAAPPPVTFKRCSRGRERARDRTRAPVPRNASISSTRS